MRRPQRQRVQKRVQISHTRSYPPPVGGWNARDALSAMKPTDAVTLENWYPTPTYVEFRGGYSSHATGMTGNGKTLAVHHDLDGTDTLWCATSSGIYNVTSAGAVGAEALARTNGKHQSVSFNDGTNSWLILVNGTDDPAYYDGTTWTAVDELTSPALTGYTGNAVEQFVSVNVFKGRLFFIPINSLSFWYLSAGVAGGALTEFSLGGEAKRGGYLMAMATWTRDAGDGMDDLAVFITSEGEAIVYQGNNPSSSAAWAKVGTFNIGRPIGRRCIVQYAGDCVIITEDGVYPLSALLQAGEAKRDKFAFSFKIENAFTDSARAYQGNFGWEAIVYPAHNALLVNVPLSEDGTHHQYVMNTITNAWCKFTGWDAETFAVLGSKLYFADATAVYQGWNTTADNGTNIVFYGKQAFQDFGIASNKSVKLFMPILSVNGNVAYAAGVDVDFEDDEITTTVSYSVAESALWDTAVWDAGLWRSGQEIVKQWSSPSEWTGRWLSGKLKIVSTDLVCQWMGSTMIFEDGGPL